VTNHRRYTAISAILRKSGPQLSSAVAAQLIYQGATPGNARKLIQRAGDSILRLPEIRFPHRESFLYLPDQRDTERFWERLLLAFRTTNSVYGLAIDALAIRGGSVPMAYFPLVSGSPNKLRGHISAERVLEGLQRLGVLNVLPDPTWQASVTLRPQIPGVFGAGIARARMLAEDIAADATKTFLQRTGLGSYSKVKVRNTSEAPSFGAFHWDLTAPCYISPLRRFKKGQKSFIPGFVVADILLGSELDLPQVQPFLHKTEVMRANPKTALFLSILIADGFTKEALQAGKAVGHLMLTTETLFTKDIADALSALIQVLTHAATAALEYPGLIYDLFDQLRAIEGGVSSIRGPLFELWLARCLGLDGWEIRGVGWRTKVQSTGERAEVDVFAEQANGKRIRMCEAKAHASPVRVEEVEDWISRQIPRIRQAILQNRDGATPALSFEFWTTNTFSPEATEYLKAAAKRTKTYTIKGFDRTALQHLAKKSGDEYLVKILEDFFLRNSASGRLEKAKLRQSQIKSLSGERQSTPVRSPVFMNPTSYEEHL
jgi:hypothetical protein